MPGDDSQFLTLRAMNFSNVEALDALPVWLGSSLVVVTTRLRGDTATADSSCAPVLFSEAMGEDVEMVEIQQLCKMGAAFFFLALSTKMENNKGCCALPIAT